MALDTKEKVTPEGRATDDAFTGIMSHPDNADLRNSLGSLEQNPDKVANDAANENPMNFIRDNVSIADKPPGKNRFSEWLGRNKWSVAGGGSAIILLGGLFTIAAPLKLQGILSSIQDTTSGRLESYVERRTRKVFLQGIMQRFGIQDDRNLVKGGSLVERLGKTMAASKYEERLAAKGLEFSRAADGTLRVRALDPTKGLVIKTGSFKTVSEVESFIDGIPVTKKVLKAIIKEDMGVWGYFVRGKLTRWMMSYLGIKRFGTQKTDKTATPEEKQATQALDDVADSLEAQAKALDNGMDIMNTAENANKAETGAASAQAQAASKSTLKEGTKAALEEATTDIGKATTSSAIVDTVQKLTEKLGKKMADLAVGKVGSKLIPFYGEITGIATAVVFAHWAVKNTENGNAARALAMPAAILMAYSYAKWAGYSSQAREGTLDTDLYNYFAPFLENVELSSLFNCVDKNWASNCDSTGTPAYKKLNETSSEILTSIASAASTYGILFTGDRSPAYLAARLIFNLDNLLWGLVMDGAVKMITDSLAVPQAIIGLLLGPKAVAELKQGADTVIANMGKFFVEEMLKLFGLEISPTMGGNKLYDILLNGAVYSANRFGETTLGFQKISLAEASSQTQKFAAEEREYEKSKGLLYALFSPDATYSVTNRLVSRMSLDGGTVNLASNTVGSLFGIMKETPRSLAGIVSNEAAAATYTSPETVLNAIPFGMTEEQLALPLSEKLLNGEACAATSTSSQSVVAQVSAWFGISNPETTEFDTCNIDTAVAESLNCSIDPTITETAECNPDAGFVVAGNSTAGTTTGSCPAGSAVALNQGFDKASGMETNIALCAIPGTKADVISAWADPRYKGSSSLGVANLVVNASAADSLLKATQLYASTNGGAQLTGSIGYRSVYEQCSLFVGGRNHPAASQTVYYEKYCAPNMSWLQYPGGDWTTDTVISNHMSGLSIDLDDDASENWMRSCENSSIDGTNDGRCFGFYDDVYQKEGWDRAHFTYSP